MSILEDDILFSEKNACVYCGLSFDALLMKDGRYVDDLSIGQIADFIAQQRAA